jgi:hypothetical protein
LALNELSRLLFARSMEGQRHPRQRRDGVTGSQGKNESGLAKSLTTEQPHIDSGYPAD